MTTRWTAFAVAAALFCGCAGDGELSSTEGIDEAADARARVDGEALRLAVQEAVAQGGPREGLSTEDWKALQAFYAGRNHAPLWVDRRGVQGSARDLLAALCQADADGLNPADYKLPELEQALARIDAAPKELGPLVDAELKLGATYLTFGRHLALGRVPPRRAGWFARAPALDGAWVLAQLGEDVKVADALGKLRPPHPQYARLREKLAELRALEAKGGWPAVEKSAAISPGMRSPVVAQLRARLAATGEGPGDAADPELYDDALVEAVKRFQEKAALEPDGKIGSETLAALRESPADRIRQLVVNLERWRWVDRELGARHLLVNIPTFDLQGFDGKNRTLRMKVIVGLPDWETPVFSTRVEGVHFHPIWSVPKKIMSEEIVPNLRNDPQFAQKVGLRVLSKEDGSEIDPSTVDWARIDPATGEVPYRFQQPAGDDNPLGKIKLHMPNRYTIYLHDTPGEKLFATHARAYSHGCVRVEQPEELSAFVLAGSDQWSREKVQEAFDGSRPKLAEAPAPADVHLVYFTAWVEDDGTLRFPRDLYRRDRGLEKLLLPPEPAATPALCVK